MLEKKVIEAQEKCPFCELGTREIGYVNKRGSAVVYKTGDLAAKDWYAVLQPTTPSELSTGFNIQLMPVGHVEAFSEITDRELAANMGVSLGVLSYAMQTILEEEWKQENGVFVPKQIVYGKCLTPENMLKHMHYKLTPFSGEIAQAFPSDASWMKKEVHEIDGEKYVLGKPVDKRKLPPERHEHLKKRLIEILP